MIILKSQKEELICSGSHLNRDRLKKLTLLKVNIELNEKRTHRMIILTASLGAWWQHDIYEQGLGDCSVITKTVGNGLVMLCHSPTDFFYPM